MTARRREITGWKLAGARLTACVVFLILPVVLIPILLWEALKGSWRWVTTPEVPEWDKWTVDE